MGKKLSKTHLIKKKLWAIAPAQRTRIANSNARAGWRGGREGFTIIELTLALAFLSFMTVFIVAAVVQFMRTYNKGVVVKQVNQSGRSIGEELRRNFAGAVATKIDTSKTAGATNYRRVCLDGVSYVWNIPGAVGTNRYDDGTEVRFARVVEQDICNVASVTLPIQRANATELISNRLAVRQVDITSSTDRKLFTIDYTLSVPDTTLIDTATNTCKTGYEQQFCAITSFSITAYTANE